MSAPVASDASPPALSVVVAPTAARGAFLAGALDALEAQRGAPAFEVLVPVDASIAHAELAQRFPRVRFLAVSGSAELSRSPDPGLAHEAIDLRRSAGLAAARGAVVALTDEHARPRADWCAQLAALHAAAPHAAIGGAIENDRDRALNWALFFYDAGRYQNPLDEGPAQFVSDLNVAYKRAALQRVRVWQPRYHETGLHDALRAAGETTALSRAPVVGVDRGALSLGEALRERFGWARLYAGRRAREVAPLVRALLCLGAPALALLLLARQARLALARGRPRELARALPLLALLDLTASAGELTGYLTGRATRASRAGSGAR
ncbi:MAG TPA: hypothetical protein VII78_16210 [Myxococcota bacterium]